MNALLIKSAACQFFPFARVHLRFLGVAILARLCVLGGDLLCWPTSPRPNASPQSDYIEPRRMAKPPRVPMGVGGEWTCPRLWGLVALYTYTHLELEWGTWGTAAFLVGEARENTTTRPPGAPPRAHQAPSTSHWRTRTKLGPSGPSITAISIQKLVTKLSKL